MILEANKKESPSYINVRPFDSIKELREAVRCNDVSHPQSKYPRGGTTELSLLERKVANMFDLNSEGVMVFSFGMSAVVAAIENASLTKDAVIMHGTNEYSNNKKYIGKTLTKRGIIAVEAESYSIDYLQELIEKTKPQVIFLETVANGQNIPVLDLERFFEIPSLKKLNPLIILDNTLAAGLISPQEILKEGFRVIGVESGLKFYTRHRGSFGFAYTKDLTVANEIKEYRKQTGMVPDLYQTNLISERLIGRFELDRRNQKIFKNAMTLATISAEAEQEGALFSIAYPNLKSHQNFEFASKKFPGGAAPLFFIKPRGDKNQFDVAEHLLKNPIVNEACVIIESFGYDFTAIWPNADLNFVRISAGTEEEIKVKELGYAIRDSLRTIQ